MNRWVKTGLSALGIAAVLAVSACSDYSGDSSSTPSAGATPDSTDPYSHHPTNSGGPDPYGPGGPPPLPTQLQPQPQE